VKHITFVEDIQIAIVCIYHKTISNFRVKQFVKMRIFFCLFPQDLNNIDPIFNDHVSQDVTKEQFKELCKYAWSKPHNFVVIDLTSPKNYGKFNLDLPIFILLNK